MNNFFIWGIFFFSGIFCSLSVGELITENQYGKIIIANNKIQISVDPEKGYIIDNLIARDSGRSYIKKIQSIEDVEGLTSHSKGWESQAKIIDHKISETNESITLTAELVTQHLKIKKHIILQKDKSYFILKYDYYILNKLPLRVLAAPMVIFPQWIQSAAYCDRYGKTHKFTAKSVAGNKKHSVTYPGLWYAAGNKNQGALVVLPALASDYGLFGWPPEWGSGYGLVRNYNVGHLGIMFPHKLAGGSPDVKFTAGIIIGIYDKSPEKLFNKIKSDIQIESPKLKPAPSNNTASYFDCKNGLNVWIDNQSGIHRQKESLLKERKAQACNLAVAKNQDVSLQIILKSEKPFELNSVDMVGLDADVYVMEYIKLKSPSKIFTGRSAKSYPSSWPDPLKPFEKTTVKADDNQGLLLTFQIPENFSSGKHNGKIIIKFNKSNKIEIPVNLKVYDFALPRPRRFHNICNVFGYVIKHYAKLHGLTMDPYAAVIENKYSKIFSANNLNVIAYTNKSFKMAALKSNLPFVSTVFIPGEEAIVLFEGTYYPKTYKGGRIAPPPGPMPITYKTALVQRYKQCISHIRKAGYDGSIHALIFDDPLSVPEMREGLLSIIPVLRQLDCKLKLVGCMKNNFDEEVAIKLDAVITAPDISEKLQNSIKNAQNKKQSLQWWSCLNPWTAIDTLPVGTRVLFWKFAAKGICGTWNWDGMALWDKIGNDVYAPTKQGNWWGEGYLIYPPVNSPRQSLRLIQFRCGIDEYEYLIILQNAMANCKNKELHSEAQKLLKQISAWKVNPAEPEINANMISELQSKVANMILRMKKE